MCLAVGIDYGIPDDGLRGGRVGRRVGGGIGSRNPDEQLLSVPIEEGCKVCLRSVSVSLAFCHLATYRRRDRI